MIENVCGIYMIQNKINGKIYIGKSKNISNRYKEHLNSAKNGRKEHLYSSIRKYGENNFTITVLKICEYDKSILNYYERLYINLYHSNDKEFGYNMTVGGDGGRTMSLERYSESAIEYFERETEDARNKRILNMKISHNTEEFKTNQSKKLKNYYDNLSDEDRNKLKEQRRITSQREDIKERIEKGRLIWWNSLSEEDKRKLYSNRKKFSRKLLCVETNEVKRISEWQELGYKNIYRLVRGGQNTCKGYHFVLED